MHIAANSIKDTLFSIAQLLGRAFPAHSVEVIDRGVPHAAPTLPNGKMGIYMFACHDVILKIGKVGPKSNARFHTQHYLPTSTQSNLARSILADKDFCAEHGVDTQDIKNWMLNHLRRVDILLDEELGMSTLDLFEMCLQYQYLPKYEGFTSQRK